MEQYLPELLKQGTWAIVAGGLILALKMLRAEHAEREKLWKVILDEERKRNDDLQAENVATLKEDIKLRAQIDAKLEALHTRLDVLTTKGG